jgi:hypothetical protein
VYGASEKRPNNNSRLKDATSIVISSTALLISATTAYFNIVWQSDDIRVVAGEFSVSYDNMTKKVVLGEIPQWTFINSGNRSVAIRRITLAVADSHVNFDCLSSGAKTFSYEIEPFVIKPSEIVPKTFHLKQGENVNDSKVAVELSESGSLLLCATTSIITPSSAVYRGVILLWLINIDDLDRNRIEFARLYDTGVPQSLLSRQTGVTDILASAWDKIRNTTVGWTRDVLKDARRAYDAIRRAVHRAMIGSTGTS